MSPTYDGHVEEAQVALDPLRREEDGAVELGRQRHSDARLGRVGARAGAVQARVVHLVMHVPDDSRHRHGQMGGTGRGFRRKAGEQTLCTNGTQAKYN